MVQENKGCYSESNTSLRHYPDASLFQKLRYYDTFTVKKLLNCHFVYRYRKFKKKQFLVGFVSFGQVAKKGSGIQIISHWVAQK